MENETPIGGRFELCKLIYEVRAATSCEGCACYIESENEALESWAYKCGISKYTLMRDCIRQQLRDLQMLTEP